MNTTKNIGIYLRLPVSEEGRTLMFYVERGGAKLRGSGDTDKVKKVLSSDMKGIRLSLRGGKDAETISDFFRRLDPSGKKCAESGMRIILLAVMEASLAVSEDRI